jgi:uncharacterized membrane protein YeiH
VILLVFDLIGTFVFASSGAVLAGRTNLDLFGTFVLSFVAGTAGGITRDVLLGATPPLALLDWRYPLVALAATGLAWAAPRFYDALNRPITVLDAFGLGLFAVAGTWRALDLGATSVTSIWVGVITAVGGGVARDLLVARVPVVLRREVYALAALAATLTVVTFEALELHRAAGGAVGVLTAASLRLFAAARDWNLPTLARPR